MYDNIIKTVMLSILLITPFLVGCEESIEEKTDDLVRAVGEDTLVSNASGETRVSENWYPSRYGADDRLGALNNLSAAKTLEAMKLVTDGKVYSLAVVTAADTPTYPGRSYQVEAFPAIDGAQGPNLLSGNDDRVIASMGMGTQIDGLGHVGINLRHYNGVPVSEILVDKRLAIYGLHEFPPVVTRGVLLDIAGLRGVDRMEAGERINRQVINAAMERQNLIIGKGDVVLLHTGWLSLMDKDAEKFMGGEPGLSIDGAEYLASLGVVAVGADNTALEHVPFADENRAFEVHQVLLARNGVFILEYIRTDELVHDGVDEFLFVLSPPRLDGTVQVIVQPVAVR